MSWKNYVESGKASIDSKQKQSEELKEKIKSKNIFHFNGDVFSEVKKNIEYYIEGKRYNSLVRFVNSRKNPYGLRINLHKNNISYFIEMEFPTCSLTKEKFPNGIYDYADGLSINYKVERVQQTLFSKLQGFLTNKSGFSITILSKSQNEKIIDLKNKKKDEIINEILPLLIDVIEDTVRSNSLN